VIFYFVQLGATLRQPGAALRQPGTALHQPGAALRQLGAILRHSGAALRHSGAALAQSIKPVHQKNAWIINLIQAFCVILFPVEVRLLERTKML
jgi:hypothetical protein